MTDGQRVNNQPLILYFTDNAKVTDSITPQAGEFPTQRLAEMPGIALPLQPRFQPVEDASRCRTIKFRELLLRERGNLNRPGQATS